IGALRGTYDPSITPGFTLEFIGNVLEHAALPIFIYIISTLGTWMLSMKSSTVSVLGEDYVTVAEARGLPARRISTAYVGRNAALPLFTQLMIAIGFVLGGAVVIEELLVYWGIGHFLFASITMRDYTSMQGVFLFITASVVFANLFADLLYGRLDPRVRVAGEGELMSATTRIELPEIHDQSNPLADLGRGIAGFFRVLVRNRAGLIGFCCLIFYFLLTFIARSFVRLDDEVKLDEIAGPPG